LQLLSLAPGARRWLDIGSGGGFPGVVLACALVERDGASIDLVERAGKKAAFLREAIRVTQSPGRVHLADIGDYVERLDKSVDCVTARAVAPLQILCEAVAPLVQRGATALLPKGQDVEKELTEATKYWNIDYRLVPSRVPEGGSIVVVDRLTRQPASTPDE
jgi:16S rRNA (guanine527-N7)-methyltransferase